MKITFFQNFSYENLSIQYLSASLKQEGYQTSLVINPQIPFFKNSIDTILKEIIETTPDFVAFSATTCEYDEIKKIAKNLKEKHPAIKTIIGGIHATCTYRLIKKEKIFDYICIGEGEKNFIDLIKSTEKNLSTDRITNIINTKTKEEPILSNTHGDLNTYPFPDKDLIYSTYPDFISESYNIITSRGCLFDCSFCYNSINQKSNLSRRTPDNVIAELKMAKQKYNPKSIFFLDSVFTYDKKWLNAFLPIYKKEIDKPFFCDIHPLCIDEDIVKKIKDAGCKCVNLGIQTIDENKRKNLFNRKESNKQIKETIQLIKKYQIGIYAHIIYDIPNETDQDILDNAIFLNKHKPDIIVPFSLTYYPKTKITRLAAKENIISSEELKSIYRGKNFTSFNKPPQKEKTKLIAFLLISSFTPKFLFNFLLNKKLYKRLPANIIFKLYLIAMPIFNRLVLQKYNFPYFYIHKRIKFVIFFMYTHLKKQIFDKKTAKVQN